jgi:hypothetical protein
MPERPDTSVITAPINASAITTTRPAPGDTILLKMAPATRPAAIDAARMSHSPPVSAGHDVGGATRLTKTASSETAAW